MKTACEESEMMPTMDEIAAKRITVFEILGQQWADSLAPIFAAARRGVEASICPDCHNTFQQPFKCATCGAQKLYDATLLEAQQRAERAEAERDAAVAREHLLANECVVAWESAVDWGGYADEYFREKHGYAADKAALDNAVQRLNDIRARADQPEYPSTADDEATRWRHGEPTEGGKS